MIEPFAVLLALLPLIAYLVVFSLIRLSGSQLVTTGGRDLAAVAFAVSGLIMIGPLELFFPRPAATVFGAKVWIVLALFYVLCVLLVALTSRPKLVIYGRTPRETFDPLLAAARVIDADATGDRETRQVFLPNAAVRLRVAGPRTIDYAEIIAFEPDVPPSVWTRLLSELRRELGRSKLTRRHGGWAMLIVAGLLSGLLIWYSFGNQELLVQGFKSWFWR
jgi:hypothetical protein